MLWHASVPYFLLLLNDVPLYGYIAFCLHFDRFIVFKSLFSCYEHSCTSSVWTYVFISLMYMPGSRIVVSYSNSIVNVFHCLNLEGKKAIIFLEPFKNTFQHLSSPVASAKLSPTQGSWRGLGTLVSHVNSNPGFAIHGVTLPSVSTSLDLCVLSYDREIFIYGLKGFCED